MPHPPRATPSRHAFTIVELLVVVSIMLLLMAILLPSMKRSRFVAREAVCASNYGQVVTAMTVYAADFTGFYPNMPIPQSIGLSPWGYHKDFLPTLARYGAGWEMWGCPLRPLTEGWSPFRPQYNVSQAVLDTRDDDAIAQDMRLNGHPTLTIGQFNYWVPTRCANGYMPHNYDPVNNTYNVWAVDDWPTRLSNQGKGHHPLVTDLLYIYPPEAPYTARQFIRGGHQYETGNVSAVGLTESINAAFADGHVERRDFSQFQLRQRQQWYVFY
ncbi:MAG: prepilin-type N-terminal cleavage/methylation domain-containing protein [Phycisphaera sp.]|nr:prepilin-type N-terminal cleavage/methylation domain-containing protein [Phycisphaera sp.]